jgi:outer membrane cobalamin receptor
MSGLLVAFALLFSQADSSLVAQLPTYTLPPIRVTAPRYRPVPAEPGTRTVLDRAWLLRRDPIDLADAMVSVAGLRVIDMGDGQSRGASLRGLPTDRVAVLVDGRPLNTAQGGGVDLGPLDPESLDRIEIVRGAVGALYGPDALGGAVHLVRREDRAPQTALRLAAGTDGRGLLRATSGWQDGRWTVDGMLRAETASPRLGDRSADASGAGFRARAAYHPLWAASLEASAEHRRDRRDVPGSVAFPSPGAGRNDDFTELALGARGVSAGRVPGSLDVDLSAFTFTRRFEDHANTLGAIDDRHENRQLRLAASWRDTLGRGDLTARIEGTADRLQSTTDGDVSRARTGATVLVQQSRGRWGGSLALRADAIEGFAPLGTVRASIARTVFGEAGSSRWVALRAGAGTSFRPPTFDDLFWPARASAAGNRRLRPETARDLDFAVEARRGASRAQIALFTSNVSDLIQWTPGADGVWRPRNVLEARLRGVEADASVGLREIGVPERIAGVPMPATLDAALNWLDAEDRTGDPVTGGMQLVGRPHAFGFGELGWKMGRWTFAVGARGTARVPLTAANTKWSDGYAVWHTRLRWQVGPSLRLDLEGRNVFDTRYEDLRGYATTGREFLLGLRYGFTTGS